MRNRKSADRGPPRRGQQTFAYGIQYAHCRSAIDWPDDQWPRFLQRLADRFAAGHFADASVAGVVSQDDDIAGEQRAVRAA